MRSTKAGAGVPATEVESALEAHRRDRRSTKAGTGVPATAAMWEATKAMQLARSTKAGTGVPATAWRFASARSCSWTLNEGRDRSPGDSRVGNQRHPSQIKVAQRRPGPESRRQALDAARDHVPVLALNEGRDRSPGDRLCEARRHRPIGDRSTKAGTGVPATAHPNSPNTGEEFRSTKAGTGVPATGQGTWSGWSRRIQSLNEGRDRSPGDRHVAVQAPGDGVPRSTKAGTGVPATASRSKSAVTAWFTAQRRPGPESRRQPGTREPPRSTPAALNEGRDRSPGDRHVAVQAPGDGVPRSTKAGTGVPATGASPAWKRGGIVLRSTKAGTGVPATASRSKSAVTAWFTAQRRPGPESRRQYVIVTV